MKKNAKGQYVVSGKAMWAKVNSKIDMYEGDEIGYTINLVVSEEDAKMVDDLARGLLKAAKENPEWTNSKKKKPTGWDGESKFAYLLKDNTLAFKTNHKYKKEDKEYPRYVQIFNKAGKLYPDYQNIMIGNGSDVTLIFSPNVYWLNKGNHGASLRLESILVHNMVSFGEVTAEDFCVPLENDFEGEEIPV